MLRIGALTTLATLALLAMTTVTAVAGTRNSGYYDHQVIEYEGTTVTANTVQEAQLLAHGNIVFHVVDQTGKPPAVQCARNTALFPNDATDCNVLNFIPGEQGYAGGAWNLQIFTWKAGLTPIALTKDDDIAAAVNAGLGTLVATNVPRRELRGSPLDVGEGTRSAGAFSRDSSARAVIAGRSTLHRCGSELSHQRRMCARSERSND